MDAFFVKYDYSMPECADPVYNYINFVSIWAYFPDYEDNSLIIPFQGDREIYDLQSAEIVA